MWRGLTAECDLDTGFHGFMDPGVLNLGAAGERRSKSESGKYREMSQSGQKCLKFSFPSLQYNES